MQADSLFPETHNVTGYLVFRLLTLDYLQLSSTENKSDFNTAHLKNDQTECKDERISSLIPPNGLCFVTYEL